MKNQYVGDVNDYRKYGLLRALTGNGEIRLGVYWMLSPSDERPDGRKLEYLQDPRRWRRYDPELYDSIGEIVGRGDRNVGAVQQSRVLPGATFFAEQLTDDLENRGCYFLAASKFFGTDVPLVFFDPDNGIEIPSVRRGAKESHRYLYLDELAETYRQGRSLVIYQHFPREKRVQYIERRGKQLLGATGAPLVASFRTGNVVFFLVCRRSHREYFARRIEVLKTSWGSEFEVALWARRTSL